MRIKKKNVARLASLSALGAGALGVAAGAAQASTIVYTPLDITVGPDGVGSARIDLPGTTGFGAANYLKFVRQTQFHTRLSHGERITSSAWRVNYTGRGIGFGAYKGHMMIVGPSRTAHTAGIWGYQIDHQFAFRGFYRNAVDNPQNPFVNSFLEGNGVTRMRGDGKSSGGNSNGDFTDQYAMFYFDGYGGVEYGWLELSYAASLTSGPDVTLEGWAYDSSGAHPPTGDTGAGAVPEPSTLALTGLAALALGATGLRRWRSAR